MIPVLFRQFTYPAAVTREILDDLDRTSDRSSDEPAASASKRLPLFLRAMEHNLAAGEVAKARRVLIVHAEFPAGPFYLIGRLSHDP